MKLVMIGHGMVGHKFIEAILEKADDYEKRINKHKYSQLLH